MTSPRFYKHRHRNLSFYFGCWKDVGHFLWIPEDYRGEGPQKVPCNGMGDLPWYPFVDGGFLPKERERYQEGLAWLTRMGDWTVLSMDDFSVDHRQGSHSTFIEYGRHSYGNMIGLAGSHFPQVFARMMALFKIWPAERAFDDPFELVPNPEAIINGELLPAPPAKRDECPHGCVDGVIVMTGNTTQDRPRSCPIHGPKSGEGA